MSELLGKQVNAQREFEKILPGFTRAPASPRKKCAMKMKVETKKKNDGRLKYFCGQEGVYKTRVMDIKRLQLNDS